MSKHNINNNIPLNFLPIQSLEKYLKHNLYDIIDHKLFRYLNDLIFHQISLTQIIEDYRNSWDFHFDWNWKKLFNKINNELKLRNKSRNDIIEIIVQYLIDNDSIVVEKITTFLKSQLQKYN